MLRKTKFMQSAAQSIHFRRAIRFIYLLSVVFAVTGCTTSRQLSDERPFVFGKDTFAYANELVWEYHFTPDGKWNATRREPEATYSLHCFVVARCAKQFFHHARFDPTKPKANRATYARLVDKVVSRNPRRISAADRKIEIPGYANLREFSEAHEALLKEECGGAWQSYFQRGNWRMVFPFSRRHQVHTAAELASRIERNIATVVHIACFPDLAINHAVLLFDVRESDTQIEFSVYDPNEPDTPTKLIFDRATRTFHFPTNKYFTGGKVNVYEVYTSVFY